MALEVAPLAYFAATVARGSIHVAARDLGVHAATVSRAITALEYALATKLIVRRPGGVVPTLEGEQLNRTAVAILNWCSGLRSLIRPSGGRRSAAMKTVSVGHYRALLNTSLSLRTLSQFSVVMEEGSISSAARRLNLTQPTLSRRIVELEAFLGTRILERGHTGAVPTDVARRLYASIAKTEALAMATMKRADVGFLHRMRDIRLGSVMPAGVDSNLTALLARVIKDSAAHDSLRSISVTAAPAQELMEQLMSGVIDAAMVDTQDIPPMFKQMEVGRRPLFLFAPAAASGTGDTVEDILKRMPLALPMTGTGLRHATDELFAARGPTPRTIECGSIPVLIRLVIDGACCAIIPGGAHPRKDPRVRIFRIPHASLITSLIWTQAKDDSAQVARIKWLVSRQKFN